MLKNYYYKGYDITNKNRLEKLKNEYVNPYGYNFESNLRTLKRVDIDKVMTNQDLVKLKEYK